MGRLTQTSVKAGLLFAGLVFGLNLPAAPAQDSPGVIFVLDGSGSMWGRIEDRTKIEVAKEIMVRLVDELPPSVQAGLVAYGHRTKGDCDDIETLAGLGSDNREALKSHINGISPKGKTPITQSLTLATEQLKQNEGDSTVVLISDGKESCGGDPCAVVRELLDHGVKATVHVVGFDVSPEEREQLMCIAEAGNGRYFPADNTAELNEALAEVKREVVAKAAEPDPKEVSLTAVPAPGNDVGPVVEWTIIDLATEAVNEIGDEGARIAVPLKPGEYEVLAVAGNFTGLATISVQGVDSEQFEVVLKASEAERPFDAPDSVAAGTVMSFEWRGPDAPGDKIFIARPDMADNKYPLSNVHKTSNGPPAHLVAPAQAGSFEIRYFSNDNATVLMRFPLEVTEHEVEMDAPRTIAPGTPMEVVWSGPCAPGDLLFIASTDMAKNKYFLSNNHKCNKGSPAQLTAPAKPGTYEIRYYSEENATVLAQRALLVR